MSPSLSVNNAINVRVIHVDTGKFRNTRLRHSPGVETPNLKHLRGGKFAHSVSLPFNKASVPLLIASIVSGCSSPAQIGNRVIRPAFRAVARQIAVWSRPNKCNEHQIVNKDRLRFVIHSEAHRSISITLRLWLENNWFRAWSFGSLKRPHRINVSARVCKIAGEVWDRFHSNRFSIIENGCLLIT